VAEGDIKTGKVCVT